jgi:hypothetical protein
VLPDAEAVTEEVCEALLQLVGALHEQELLSVEQALDLGEVLGELPGDAAAAAAFMRSYKQLAPWARRGNGKLAAALLCKKLLPAEQQQQQLLQ